MNRADAYIKYTHNGSVELDDAFPDTVVLIVICVPNVFTRITKTDEAPEFVPIWALFDPSVVNVDTVGDSGKLMYFRVPSVPKSTVPLSMVHPAGSCPPPANPAMFMAFIEHIGVVGSYTALNCGGKLLNDDGPYINFIRDLKCASCYSCVSRRHCNSHHNHMCRNELLSWHVR